MGDQSHTESLILPKKLTTLPSSHTIHRASMRGLKRCPACGQLNGQRNTICSNEYCGLRRQALQSRRPLDPVRLISHDERISLYSLRSKERNAQPRNFVQLSATDSVYNAMCYTCQSTCRSDYLCKHIAACKVGAGDDGNTAPNNEVPQAQEFTVAREVLWNLNGVSSEQKQRLWNLYKIEEFGVPAVQRISASMFVVKCEQSNVFPAGRLHVTAVSNGLSSKKGTHFCSCKKLKIILEPDNSVVMQDEVCDHILLVLAAILSNKNGKTTYGNFANTLKSFWVPSSLEVPLVDATHNDAFFGLSINIGGSFAIDGDEHGQADDIFIYGNEFLSEDNIPDFEDIGLDGGTPVRSVLQAQEIKNPVQTATTTNSVDSLLPSTGFLLPNCTIAARDAEDLHDMTSVSSIISEAATHLELSDCNIELMDQFELTDQIDLATTDDITLHSTTHELYDNGVSILEAPDLATTSSTAVSSIAMQQPTILDDTNIPPPATYFNGNSLLKSNQVLEAPPIELATIAVVKKYPIKVSEIVNEVKTRKFPLLPAKRSLIVNSKPQKEQMPQSAPKQENEGSQQLNAITEQPLPAEAPSLAYSAWLDYVIETINESISIVEEKNIQHSFHVHEEIFAHLSKSFSLGAKRRIPNSTTLLKHGQYKGLIKYTWYFPTASTVKRIFQTKNIALETERMFECKSDGNFVPYVRNIKAKESDASDTKHKRIYAKLALYKAYMCFDYGSNGTKTGLKLEWLPNAFPKSHFGILNIEYTLRIKDPQQMQSAIMTI